MASSQLNVLKVTILLCSTGLLCLALAIFFYSFIENKKDEARRRERRAVAIEENFEKLRSLTNANVEQVIVVCGGQEFGQRAELAQDYILDWKLENENQPNLSYYSLENKLEGLISGIVEDFVGDLDLVMSEIAEEKEFVRCLVDSVRDTVGEPGIFVD
ncbi:hypothetical protein GOC76_30050 [Sinorhizobium medicae]|nr:hypothetical protein [Sinorhizobium medicae]